MNSTPPRVLRWPFIAVGLLIALAPIVTGISGYVYAFMAVNGDSVDPSQKARILADGISMGMNGLLTALVAVPVGAAVILYGIMRKRPKPQLPQPRD